MKELVMERVVSREGLIDYLNILINEAKLDNPRWNDSPIGWITCLNHVIAEVENSEPLDEYFIKLFKETDEDGYFSYTLSMPVGEIKNCRI